MFRPFEANGNNQTEELDADQVAKKMLSLSQFNIVAADLNDKKSKDLYKKLQSDVPTNDGKGKKRKGGGPAKAKPVDFMEESKDPAAAARQTAVFTQIDKSLSTRLQDENPFDAFRDAVERAIIEKSMAKKKEFEPDQSFFREAEDNGMCISMHQPWA